LCRRKENTMAEKAPRKPVFKVFWVELQCTGVSRRMARVEALDEAAARRLAEALIDNGVKTFEPHFNASSPWYSIKVADSPSKARTTPQPEGELALAQ
jgi:hypothetical protein